MNKKAVIMFLVLPGLVAILAIGVVVTAGTLKEDFKPYGLGGAFLGHYRTGEVLRC